MTWNFCIIWPTGGAPALHFLRSAPFSANTTLFPGLFAFPSSESVHAYHKFKFVGKCSYISIPKEHHSDFVVFVQIKNKRICCLVWVYMSINACFCVYSWVSLHLVTWQQVVLGCFPTTPSNDTQCKRQYTTLHWTLLSQPREKRNMRYNSDIRTAPEGEKVQRLQRLFSEISVILAYLSKYIIEPHHWAKFWDPIVSPILMP